MTDNWSKQKRSEVMSLIRSSGNKETELRLIEIFRGHRITGWRRRQSLVGKPDFVFHYERVAVFVDGCFWHGCSRCYQRPGSNCKYWDAKIKRNRERDKFVGRQLRARGWYVIRIWEHELRKADQVAKRVIKILS